MPLFEYKAKTRQGESRKGAIVTSSEEAAIESLQAQGLTIISIRQKSKKGIWEMRIGSGVRNKDIVILSRQLAVLFEAQIPVVEALKTLIEETNKPALKNILSDILDNVSAGMSLSQAFSRHPDVFSGYYISLVRSGEESGKLQEIFTYLADYLERSYELTTKARNAMIYPAFVLAVFVIVVVVLLTVIIPRMLDIFKDMNQDIPYFTQLIINISDFLRSYGILVLVFAIAGILATWWWSTTPDGKRVFHWAQLHMPLFGNLYKKIYMARFADNLMTLISGGIPIIHALEITSDVVGNVIYKKALQGAIDTVRGGGTISSAFAQTPEIPVLVTQMIRIGEASGRLDFVLKNIAKFYQTDVDSTIDSLTALVEPILIVALGGMVALLLVAILVPMYNMIGSIK